MVYWEYNDGGRTAAGHIGNSNDCVCRSIAIATGIPYQTIYDLINRMSETEHTGIIRRERSNAETGVWTTTIFKIMKLLGWKYRVTLFKKANSLPLGRFVVDCYGHLVAVINGISYDIFNSLRDGRRRVFGYYYKALG